MTLRTCLPLPLPLCAGLALALAGAVIFGDDLSVMAQTPAGADVTKAVDWGFDLLQGVVVPVLLAVATAATGILAALVKKKLGLDATMAEAALNATLHAGIERGAKAMEAEFRDRLYDPEGKVVVSTKSQGVDFVIERTASLLPETLEKLGVSPMKLRRLATEAVEARLGAAAAPATP